MAWGPLVSVDDLAKVIGQSDVLPLDCRHDLKDPEAGPRAFISGHLPGAVHAHIDRDLSGPILPTTGRHPLPDGDAFRATCSRWGITRRTRVAAYDDRGGIWAARAWWLLRDYGHDNVAVLDGGLPAWTRAGIPLSIHATAPTPANFEGRPGRMPAIDAAAVLSRVEANGHVLLDARAPERYRGDEEPIDPVAGRIPGALNLPNANLLDADGRFLSPARLREVILAQTRGRPADDVTVYCGSGVTSAHLVLAFEVAGLSRPRLYPGSWSEWIRAPDRPVARGDPHHSH